MNRLKPTENKILKSHELVKTVAAWRLKSEVLVFTNGCFDILHKGHVTYLAQAASLGDHLIIGLNSDHSIKLLSKGVGRPIQDEDARALLLASLQFVDVVCIFNEETPISLIRATKPDVLVKGGDWQVEDIAGSDEVLSYGGRVEIIPLLEGYSTTSIEQRIRDGKD